MSMNVRPSNPTHGHPLDGNLFLDFIERSIPTMNLFWQSTLSRLILSYVPMIDFISRMERLPKTIASFGSGSCAHECFLASAIPDATVYCHDISDKYIPKYLRDMVIDGSSKIQFETIGLEKDNSEIFKEKFDFVFSIQTLEHIENYRSFLRLLSQAVRPGGYLYIDAPYYHMEDGREDANRLMIERERQWKLHEHYHIGFSPRRLVQDSLLSDFSVSRMGYYSFNNGDAMIMKVFRIRVVRETKGV